MIGSRKQSIIFLLAAVQRLLTQPPVDIYGEFGSAVVEVPRTQSRIMCDTRIYIYMHIHICIYIYTVCMYVCMHACMHACIYVRMYVCIYVCMYACIFWNPAL